MARKKIERCSLTIRLPKDLYDKLVEIAKERGIDLTPMIYQLLNRGINVEREMEHLFFDRFKS